MLRLLLILLATFWAWETLRFVLETYAGRVFSLTRPVHPLVVAALPLYVLWPDWVAALGVAGATGLLVVWTERLFVSEPVQQVQVPRRRQPGSLPPLP